MNYTIKLNYAEIKQISIVDYLSFLGIVPVIRTSQYFRYKAPGRKDSEPSLTVYHKKNDWCDFGSTSQIRGGDLPKLVQYLFGCSPEESKRKLEDYASGQSFSPCMPIAVSNHIKEEKNLIQIIDIKEISHWHLISYLNIRKIPLDVAKKYVQEAHYTIGSKPRELHSLAFKNDAGGYVLRHNHQKKPLTSKPAYYTSIQGENNSSINVFEGFFDFLSYLVIEQLAIPRNNCLILNSVSNLPLALPVLRESNEVFLYLDNDDTGKEKTDLLKSTLISVYDCSGLYSGYKDYNLYLQKHN